MPGSVGAACAASRQYSQGKSSIPKKTSEDLERLRNLADEPCTSTLGRQESPTGETGERVQNLKEAIQSTTVEELKVPKPGEDHWILKSIWFQVSVNLLTLLNTLQLGMEADHPEWRGVWTICENVFTTGFFLEMLVKLKIMRFKYFYEMANILDCALVLLGILDCWILSQLDSGGADLQALSILRILRLVRLARIFKLVRSLKPLVLVIQGITATMSTLMYVFALLVLIFYVFAIFFKENLAGNVDPDLYPGYSFDTEVIDAQEVMLNYNPSVYWGSMWLSMITLFNMATFNEWQEVIRPLSIKQPYFVPIFVLYAILVAFGVMNVMTGLIVDSVIAEAKSLDDAHHESIMKARLKTLEKVQEILADMDLDGDGEINHAEMCFAMKSNPSFNKLLRSINLPSAWSAEELLDMLDNNGDGVLQEAEFTTSFFRLLESDQFQQVCILQASINQVKRKVAEGNQSLQSRFASLEGEFMRDMRLIKAKMGLAASAQAGTPDVVTNGQSGELLPQDLSQHRERANSGDTSHGEFTRCLDGVCNELKLRVEQMSHTQLMKSLDAAYTVMKESFKKELVSMKPSLEAAIMENRHILGEDADAIQSAYSFSRQASREGPALIVEDRSWSGSGRRPSMSKAAGLNIGIERADGTSSAPLSPRNKRSSRSVQSPLQSSLLNPAGDSAKFKAADGVGVLDADATQPRPSSEPLGGDVGDVDKNAAMGVPPVAFLRL